MNTEDNRDVPKIAILGLTAGAARLALRVAHELPNCTVYLPARLEAVAQSLACEPAKQQGREGEQNAETPGLFRHVVWFTNWQETISETFISYEALICIMATGIAVRSLASLLQSKYHDPAVLVLDEHGHFVISLLSGHVGGANHLAREVAEKLGGQAVITTATDVAGKPALDLIAQQMDGMVEPAALLKKFNRYLAEGNTINLYSPWPLQASFQEGFKQQAWLSCSEDYQVINQEKLLEPAVIISPYRWSLAQEADVIQIRPKNLAVGIGCRKGVPRSELRLALEDVFTSFGLDIECIHKLASIDFKTSEPGIVELADELQVPLLGFSRSEITALDGCYEASQQVFERIGVGGVCEPAVLLATNHGLILIPKQKCGRVTISVAMEKSWWWDWDPVSGI